MTDHPITPPPELMRHWSRFQGDTHPEALWFRIANEAAQWGADQELEACTAWLRRASYGHAPDLASNLRAARRPTPPSLKKQALKAAHIELDPQGRNGSLIIRALEALPDD